MHSLLQRNIFLADISLHISFPLIISLLSVLVPVVCKAEFVLNPSFEQGVSSWSQVGGSGGSTLSIDSSTSALGSSSLRVVSRTAKQNGPSQNVTSAVLAIGNGGNASVRYSIKTDAPSSTRLLLLISTSSGSSYIILGEGLTVSTSTWNEFTGSTIISWSGTLNQATLFFEVDRPAETNNYPSYNLDNVSLDYDPDGDAVGNDAESLIGTSSILSDSDGDKMTDDWEIEAGLNPSLQDALLDPDGDGFTNLEEFWAATDPSSVNSFPGKSSNPLVDEQTKTILRYLALLPSMSLTISGQHITDPNVDFDNAITALEQATGKQVGLLSVAYEGQNGGFQISEMNNRVINHWSRGGLVLVKYQMTNPWTMASINSVRALPSLGTDGNVDQLALAQGTAEQTAVANYLSMLDQVADGLEALRDAGITVLFRPYSEMTGAHFWHGYRPQDGYVAMWRHTYDYITKTRGLNNLVWVYESHRPPHRNIPVDYYYPGDDYVDVISHNYYDDTWVPQFQTARVLKRYPKISGVPQAGPGNIVDGSWDNMTMVSAFLNYYPRYSFLVNWNSFPSGSSSAHMSILDNLNAVSYLSSPNVVSLDEVDWKRYGPPTITTNVDLGKISLGELKVISLAADSAIGGVKWSIVSGAAPTGMSLLEGGQLSGTPTTAGDYSFMAQARDRVGQVSSSTFLLNVEESTSPMLPLKISSPSKLPSAKVKKSYKYTLVAEGGEAPYTWSKKGRKAKWLKISSDGLLSGKPKKVGKHKITFQVLDKNGESASLDTTIKVKERKHK